MQLLENAEEVSLTPRVPDLPGTIPGPAPTVCRLGTTQRDRMVMVV